MSSHRRISSVSKKDARSLDNGKLLVSDNLEIILIICLITFPSDWSTVAAMCPVFLYINRGDFKKQSLTMLIWTTI